MLQHIWRDLLSVNEIGIDADFFDFGGHSLLAVRLINRCNRTFDTELPLRILFERPTIESLATAVRDRRQPRAFSPLVTLQPDGFKPPLFCIHPAGGAVFCYMNLARALAPDQPVYGLQASGLDPGETPASSIATMADDYLAAIRAVRSHGPYHLLGWSFGGLVAHAIACRLRQAGETVALLAMLDTAAPQTGGTAPPDDRTVMAELANVLALAGSGTAPAAPVESLEELTRIARDSGMFPSDFSEAQTERLLAVYGMTLRLPLDHRPTRFDGDVRLFAADGSDPERLARDWAPFVTGTIVTTAIPCRHERMTAPEAVEPIANLLSNLIRSEIPQSNEQLFAAK